MDGTWYYITVALIVLTYWVYDTITRPAPLSPVFKQGRVFYVPDGDTIWVRRFLVIIKIRLWGIEAPNEKQKGFLESKYALHDIVNGKRIRYIDQGSKSYDRINARVFVKRQEVNCLMIEQGHAKHWRKFSKGFYDDVSHSVFKI